MKKYRIFAIVIAVMMFFSAAVSCKGNDGDTTDPSKQSEENKDHTDKDGEQTEREKNNEETVVKTDGIISAIDKNVKISISSDMTENSDSVKELSYFFNESMSFTPDIVSDTVTPQEETYYIALGKDNAMLKARAAEKNYRIRGLDDLGRNGIALKTFDNVTCLYGYKNESTVNAVYKFLEKTFSYEFFASGEYTIKTYLRTNWRDFDITYKPLIETPCLMYAPLMADPSWCRRLRVKNYYGTWISSLYAHTHMMLLPKAVYQEEHPEWYSPNGVDICYTRGGDEIINEMAKAVEGRIATSNDNRQYLSISQADSFTVCNCESCKREIAKFENEKVGASYLNIDFTNKVVRKVNEWIAANCPERNVTFVTFAYNATKYPPVKFNSETGKYEPLIKAEKNLNVQFVINFVDYAKPYTENESYISMMEGWHAVADDISIWQYSTNFNNYFEPFENWGSLAANYKWLAENGVSYIAEQATHNSVASNFEEMRMYVMAELCWGETDDTDYLVNKFLKVYYKEAYREMRDIYDLTRSNIAVAMATTGVTIASGGSELMQSSNWSSLFLGKLEGKINSALEKIEKYKDTDKDLYNTLVQRIEKERIWINYWQLVFYPNEYPDFDARWNKLMNDCSILGIRTHE